MQQIDVNEAKSHLSELLEAAIRGEDIVITQQDRPLVRLVPITQPRPRAQFGSAAGLITIAEDFDEPLEEFADYMK